jgi:hypothetical protein
MGKWIHETTSITLEWRHRYRSNSHPILSEGRFSGRSFDRCFKFPFDFHVRGIWTAGYLEVGCARSCEMLSATMMFHS